MKGCKATRSKRGVLQKTEIGKSIWGKNGKWKANVGGVGWGERKT